MEFRGIIIIPIAIILLFFFGNIILADDIQNVAIQTEQYNNCVSIGLLQGGGALIGVDYERLLFKNITLQIGGGLLAIGGAMNIHFEPTVSSSALSICSWNQVIYREDIWDNFLWTDKKIPHTQIAQSIIGVTYLHRSQAGPTAQIGIGYLVYFWEKGFKEELPPIMLLGSVGWAFKF